MNQRSFRRVAVTSFGAFSSCRVASYGLTAAVAAILWNGSVAATELGAYRGPGCDGVNAMPVIETFLGRKIERTVDALNPESWAALKSSSPWIAKCWAATSIKLTLSVPMLPRDHSGTLVQGAAGAYDDVFRDVAKDLIANGLDTTIVRIGWEFNGDWQPWAANSDPESYKRYFRRIVEVMRSVEGQKFQFEWCPNFGRKAIEPDKAYPGDDVVDIIGMDVYAETWDDMPSDPKARWKRYLEVPFGLKWHRDFARQHGKPISYPEWGVGTRPDGRGVGDDPVFVAGMADWFKRAKPLYQSYWDVQASDYNSQMSNSQFPKASAVFRQRFGAPKS